MAEIPEVTFTEAVVLAAAREQAGGADFEDRGFLPPLRVLLAGFEAAPMHAQGRAAQFARIVESLVTRLRFEETLRRHPEILREEIGAPIVVIGQARTGTTRLHRLLAADRRFFAPLWWEMRNPIPPPEVEANPRATDPRIALAHEQVRQILEAMPVLASAHPWDAEGADEEVLLTEHAFYSYVPESSTDLPEYRAWLDAADWAPAYKYLRLMLQFLQWQKKRRGESAQQWVLKAPQHLGYIDALRAEFPGAFVMQTHRDPLETIASSASYYSALWALNQSEVDYAEVGRQCQQRFGWALRRCLEARARCGDAGFVDAWFADIGRNPMGELQRMYSAAGLQWGAENEAAMQQWLRDNAREKRPPHEYTLQKFGLTREGIEAEFAAYRERFILPHQGNA